MNKESSIKQLKRIKQDMTHADDVNALDFAIRYMEDKALEQKPTEWQKDHEILKAYSDGANEVLEKIRAEIEQTARDCDEYNDYGRVYGLQIALDIIDKYREG